ncbi:MAG TPA: DUF1858 domain-containing protein [Bacteroidales bacterium]|nr:DUF1858 domain-containing protein [Bacteroidales bacterium]HRZ50282.1 DUF1858 domain-containing protein [Bacteroidales bacterium]
MEKLIITPKTKIYDLLEAYPELETLLTEAAPPFSKLKNPVLRKTITRITTLSQAAVIGGLRVEDLVNRLRNAAGQSTLESVASDSGSYQTLKPAWFSEEALTTTIDIREMLNAGEQPVHEVLGAIKHLKEEEILRVIAPFIPAPLLDKSLSMEHQHWVAKQGEEEYWVYFRK